MRLNDAALVVDMDGTLIKSDSLHETLLRLVVEHPIPSIGLPGLVTRGKPEFKRLVADRKILAPDNLPYNEAVIEMVRRARAEGRTTALVSAADHRQVEVVAAHLGLFDLAVGTGAMAAGAGNIAGSGKAALLRQTFGEKGFDYIGDSRADLPVWAAARDAYVVGPSTGLHKAAEEHGLRLIAVDKPGPRWRPALRAMRPHQWSKNFLVLLPALAAHDLSALGPALIAMLIFCFVASSVYLLNDLIDLPSDRAHPRKRLRPFASGALKIRDGLMLAAGLMVVSLLLSLALLPPLFLAVLALYFVTTFAYSIWLKRKVLIDVVTLAGLYTLRIIAGAAATGIILSPWLLGFSMFIFFSLAAIKRQAELTDFGKNGDEKPAGRGYMASDLPVVRGIAISAGQAAVLVFALYVNSTAIEDLYKRPELMWLICPILLYWLGRMELMTHRGYMSDDPIVFAARDRVSQVCVLTMALVVVAAVFGG
ncbi:UbiA family prenyltransferase [Paracoccus sp. MBLB3053]|uniref:UbiA family prenyltransferase n=1 Tax=Paracoccus aurantius TaxID=3073814 RepID=A0ABU2HUA7_9RHOB|nr:UbiA family prenyltransferase [Paracoccus sp. MBLB3053]MDS9468640.1 UbiA family prenyltransferase [Paracoccus sp. MBLB3053]